MASTFQIGLQPRQLYSDDRLVIIATSMGTIFEWYDLFLYGVMTPIFAQHFFGGVDLLAGFVFYFLIFASGYISEALGAVLFGQLGDRLGRRYCFVMTIALMGLATTIVGCLPSYSVIGIAAPIILVIARIIQGVAIGGEYAGAAIYVAEYAPARERGTYTSLVQVSPSLGLFMMLFVIIAVQIFIPAEAYNEWGWRIPFGLSAILLFFSLYIRLKLEESPVFEDLRRQRKISRTPLRDTFSKWANLKQVLIAFFALTACVGVVQFTQGYYVLAFLGLTLKVDPLIYSGLMMLALLLGMPFFLIFGNLSDIVGRKPIFLAGCVLVATTYIPLFHGLTHYANPLLEAATERAPAVIVTDFSTCSIQFGFIGTSSLTTPCDVAKSALNARGISYTYRSGAADGTASIEIGKSAVPSYDGHAPDAAALGDAFVERLNTVLAKAGYPTKADPAEIDYGMVTVILMIFLLYTAMINGPLAAMLVDMFPASVRYTSFSTSWCVGFGWVGGFLAPAAFTITNTTGDIYAGLWYPIVTVIISALVTLVFYRESSSAA